MNEGQIARHVRIRGRVQGVGYRAWTEQAALRHGLEGWARNRRDGSVEALFVGPAAGVAQMIAACRAGPRGSQVSAIEESDAAPDLLSQRRPGERFSVLPSL